MAKLCNQQHVVHEKGLLSWVFPSLQIIEKIPSQLIYNQENNKLALIQHQLWSMNSQKAYWRLEIKHQ